MLEWIRLKDWYSNAGMNDIASQQWMDKFIELLRLEMDMHPNRLKDSKRKRRNIRKKYDNVK